MLLRLEELEYKLVVESRRAPERETRAVAWAVSAVVFLSLLFLWLWFLSLEPWNPPYIEDLVTFNAKARSRIRSLFGMLCVASALLPALLVRELRGEVERMELRGVQMMLTPRQTAFVFKGTRSFDLLEVTEVRPRAARITFRYAGSEYEFGRALTSLERTRVVSCIRAYYERIGIPFV